MAQVTLTLLRLHGVKFYEQTESKKVEEALQDADWVQAMQEELNEFERNKVWNLVPRPKNRSIGGTKWFSDLNKQKISVLIGISTYWKSGLNVISGLKVISELKGPRKPTKLSIVVANQPAKTVPKEKNEYTADDISSIAKDAKVRHLMHSAIDNVMSNRVIHCKTAKEIWDALEIRCQGTDAIKKNRRTILTQEFVKLLNDLSLVDKEYDLEDSNLKFLLALPESWDLKSTTIRDNYALDETTLDEIYGMFKTHELEMDQRSKRHGRKSRIIALKAEEESPKVAASKKGKGKALIIKSDSESSSTDDDDSETESLPEVDVDEERMKLCALMVKGITKIAYRKFRRGKKFSRKSGSSYKKGFRKSEGKVGKYDIGDYSNVKWYNCGEKGHISPDCKKGKSDKVRLLSQRRKAGQILQILKMRRIMP
ncbi:hypothetical protein AgCh_025054 [Apium graveolens]